MEKKYLDYEGLKTLVDRIKELGPDWSPVSSETVEP